MTSHIVVAPMTGRILEISVATGTSVKENDLLVVIESMKMENEIHSPVAGTVTEIGIVSDQAVMEGDTLIVIDG